MSTEAGSTASTGKPPPRWLIKSMTRTHIFLHRLTGGRPLLSKAVVAALPESYLAPGLGAIQARYPEIEIGSYPFYRMGVFGVRLVLRAPQPRHLEAAAGEVRELVRELGADPRDKV